MESQDYLHLERGWHIKQEARILGKIKNVKAPKLGKIECEIIKGRKRDCFNMAYEDCK